MNVPRLPESGYRYPVPQLPPKPPTYSVGSFVSVVKFKRVCMVVGLAAINGRWEYSVIPVWSESGCLEIESEYFYADKLSPVSSVNTLDLGAIAHENGKNGQVRREPEPEPRSVQNGSALTA